MSEGIEAPFPVISAHPAGADSAKRHGTIDDLCNAFVDSNAAGGGFPDNSLGIFSSVKVQCQRFWSLFDKSNGLVH